MLHIKYYSENEETSFSESCIMFSPRIHPVAIVIVLA